MKQYIRRLISFVVIVNLKLFTWVTKRPRARVLVLDEHERVLLVQQYISHGKWTLPGGGLMRNESPGAAARRELYDETGIAVHESDLIYLATLKRPEYDIPFTAPLFRVNVSSSALPVKLVNPREIVAIGWYDQKNLPEPVSLTVLRALEINRK